MSERPTLTISASCPTCGGKRHISNSTRVDGGNITICGVCPDCTDGTIRQAVNCAGCRWWTQGADEDGDADYYGDCEPWRITTRIDFGCLSWEAKA